MVQFLFELAPSKSTSSDDPGTVLGSQLLAVDQLLSEPPPSQTVIGGANQFAPLFPESVLEGGEMSAVPAWSLTSTSATS